MTTLKFTTTGTGAPLVFLHGLGTSSWMWGPQISALADRFTCITIDLPNCGASHQVEWVSFENSADLVAEVLRGLPQPAHVVGLSLGAYVALRVLERHPTLVNSCITTGASTRRLMHPALMAPVSVLSAHMVKWPWLGRRSAAMMGMDDAATNAYLHDLSLLRPRDVRRIYTQINSFAPPQLDAHQIDKLLFTSGEKEATAILKSAEDLTHLYPALETGTAQGMHHAWSAENPSLFNDMICGWTRDRHNILRLKKSGTGERT